MTACPSVDRLTALLDERLNEAELADFEAHLETCVTCQGALETLTETRLSSPDWSTATDSTRPPAAVVAESSLLDPSLRIESDSWRQRLILDRSSRQPSTFHTDPADAIDPGDGSELGTAWPPQVDGYDIVGRLGRGGMGVVYRARQRGLDRLVALKMLRGGGHADPESLARFRIEVRSVARLRHPNVVQVYDVGESRGLPFVALELLEGGSLDARTGGNPQPEADSAALLATLARAVAAAHEAGIVHRDLKPTNILFTRDGIPKVTDFGLAKRLDEDDGQTQSGQVMGSPSFMAPEQARGEGRHVGPLADVYSLGAILYEMLTGRPPFKGSSPLETLSLVVRAEPVPPTKLRPGLARDLETICLKCLSKEPADRYPTAGDLANDLDRWLRGSPIQARRVRLVERGWKWARREPTAALLVLTVGLIGVILVGLGIQAVETRRDQIARIAWGQSEGTRLYDEARAAYLDQRWGPGRVALNRSLRMLADSAELGEIRRRSEALLDAIEHGEADRQNLDRFFHAARMAQLADAEWFLTGGPTGGDPRPVRQATQSALELVGKFAVNPSDDPPSWRPGLPPPWLPMVDRTALELTCQDLILLRAAAIGRPAPGETATVQARRALELLGDVGGSPTRKRAWIDLEAWLLAGVGKTQEAEAIRRRADQTSPIDARDHFAVGRECSNRGDWSGATAAFEAALRLDPNQFAAQLGLALAELRGNRPEAARPILTVCLQREPKAIGLYLLRGLAIGQAARQRRQTARSPNDPATRDEVERLFRDAEADFQQALDLRPSPEERSILLLNRGMVRFLAGNHTEAETDLAEAVRLAPDRVEARINWAQSLRALGRTAAAVDQLTHAITLDPTRSRLYRERALVQLDGPTRLESLAVERAIDDLSQAIRLGPLESVETAGNHALRARWLHKTGRWTEALADADATLRIVPGHADAALVRIQTLLDLKEYAEVVRACDEALESHRDAAELWELRGLARSFRQDFGTAINDFTHAINLDPTRWSARIQRGWAYFLSDAPRLALEDFNTVIDEYPDHAEAYGCRGFALASTGRPRDAVLDAENSLRFADPTDTRSLYNAARIYARSATSLLASSGPKRPPDAIALAENYRNRALSLIERALDQMPSDRRQTFNRDVIQTDPALAGIRPRLATDRLGQLRKQPAR